MVGQLTEKRAYHTLIPRLLAQVLHESDPSLAAKILKLLVSSNIHLLFPPS